MRKSVILICVLLIIVLLSLTVLAFSFNIENYEDTRTSAVCSGNVCQDYLFTCLNGKIINSQTISGIVIFDDDWVDEREDKDLC